MAESTCNQVAQRACLPQCISTFAHSQSGQTQQLKLSPNVTKRQERIRPAIRLDLVLKHGGKDLLGLTFAMNLTAKNLLTHATTPGILKAQFRVLQHVFVNNCCMDQVVVHMHIQLDVIFRALATQDSQDHHKFLHPYHPSRTKPRKSSTILKAILGFLLPWLRFVQFVGFEAQQQLCCREASVGQLGEHRQGVVAGRDACPSHLLGKPRG